MTAISDRERGLTLIEMLVAISLFAIVSTLITTLVVTVSQSFSREASEQDSTRTAVLGMQQISRVIRSGTEVPVSTSWQALPAFESARADSMILNGYLDTPSTATGPTRVSLAVNAAGELVETRFPSTRSGGDWVFATTPNRTRVVVRDVAPRGTPLATGTSPALFTYLKADGTALTIPSTGALTETQRREIVAVRVSLVVQTAASDDAAPAQLLSTVGIPNLNLTRGGL
ncbi:prepilin-type N-terminal cleavage/methylation domain-containing protein [Agrococcus sp. UYP33]